MNKAQPKPRTSRFNRFQTSVSGLTHVHTAVDAHFDPYTEPPRRVERSNEELERVPCIQVDATTANAVGRG